MRAEPPPPPRRRDRESEPAHESRRRPAAPRQRCPYLEQIIREKAGPFKLLTRFKADCSKQTFTAGQSFVEMGEKDVVFVKNEGTTPTEVEATLIHPTGAAPRSEEDAPASCNP